ncbi:acid type B receptor subunit 2 [Seminavis robusta]|uniref:Acid type B receptor subunit 2 n=1 Tax=Seminavis robusta TaxID=568900 RepID=A0A9N8DGS2_9STRA|nr:acid type B receptor subunit 2 [Seminavis robusta]|eukprot:Sro134_g063580.1 acid type B receptor subunit 2 (933) ;mRNA; r:88272-91169
MMTNSPLPVSSIGTLLSLAVIALASSSEVIAHTNLSSTINLRAAILTKTVPLAFVSNESATRGDDDLSFPMFQGFQPDLLRAIQGVARDIHNVTLSFDITEAPPFAYDASFDLVTEDCNTTVNPQPLEDCNKYDFLVGDFYAFYPRSMRTTFTPSFLTTAAAAVKYIHRTKRDITTLEEAQARQEPICLLSDSFYDVQTLKRYPDMRYRSCPHHAQCLEWLKAEECVLFVEDELQLRHLTVKDPELEVTREKFNENFVLWPMNARLDPHLQRFLVTLIYQAKELGILDSLYDKYFSVNFCPIGKSGPNCDQPCNPSHGISNRFGECVCDSTKWTGDDCSVQAEEDLHMLPTSLKAIAYCLVGINFLMAFCCAVWLAFQRKRAQVKIAQPHLLFLVLLGCVISTSTIIALAQEDEGDGPVPACSVFPWLYSVGFSITFGALFGKIRRIYILTKAAAEMKRVVVSIKETALIVAAILAVDVAILTVWSAVDPLRWTRTVISEDKYGYALESAGQCESDHWVVFAAVIGSFHFLLLCTACYMCYLARHIPNRFTNGKMLAIAMVSNMQIFIVVIPILVILGSDPKTSFFVRAVSIWINDFIIVALLFGNLIYKVYLWDEEVKLRDKLRCSRLDSNQTIQAELRNLAQQMRGPSSRGLTRGMGTHDFKRTTSQCSLESLRRGASQSSLESLKRGASIPTFAGTLSTMGTSVGSNLTASMDFDVSSNHTRKMFTSTGNLALEMVSEDDDECLSSDDDSSSAPTMHDESGVSDGDAVPMERIQTEDFILGLRSSASPTEASSDPSKESPPCDDNQDLREDSTISSSFPDLLDDDDDSDSDSSHHGDEENAQSSQQEEIPTSVQCDEEATAQHEEIPTSVQCDNETTPFSHLPRRGASSLVSSRTTSVRRAAIVSNSLVPEAPPSSCSSPSRTARQQLF